ncbi:MAG: DNA-processing protein DprA [Chlamydiota bacterium]|nr:DNA-processing protein DprA [Chlamydiota bacterium]
MNELESLTVLSGAPLIGSVKTRVLIDTFGSATHAINAGADSWLSISGFGPKLVESWKKWYASNIWMKNLELAQKFDVTILPYTDPKFPKRLLEIKDHPIILYIKGCITPADDKSIAVVGTRKSSIYGTEMARKISSELVDYDFTVISGLARGIDTTAHYAALQNQGRTIAVIGSGLANIYPRENSKLACEIIENGAVISEFPMNTPPDRQNFPQRNRIVSGMTLGTLLIEAPKKSGAMITMHQAISQGRKAFAIPGRADSENFQGNLQLLKEGKAQLVQNGWEIASNFEKIYDHSLPKKIMPAPKNTVVLNNEEHSLLSLLPNEELSIDKIVELSKLPVMKINVLLISLLLKNVIKEYPGKMYKKLV